MPVLLPMDDLPTVEEPLPLVPSFPQLCSSAATSTTAGPGFASTAQQTEPFDQSDCPPEGCHVQISASAQGASFVRLL